eukprot:1160054-Pelagomonas_calceolata.AAC.9
MGIPKKGWCCISKLASWRSLGTVQLRLILQGTLHPALPGLPSECLLSHLGQATQNLPIQLDGTCHGHEVILCHVRAPSTCTYTRVLRTDSPVIFGIYCAKEWAGFGSSSKLTHSSHRSKALLHFLQLLQLLLHIRKGGHSGNL